MAECANKEGDQRCHIAGDVGPGGAVDMAAEEVVDRDVPFAGEFKP